MLKTGDFVRVCTESLSGLDYNGIIVKRVSGYSQVGYLVWFYDGTDGYYDEKEIVLTRSADVSDVEFLLTCSESQLREYAIREFIR